MNKGIEYPCSAYSESHTPMAKKIRTYSSRASQALRLLASLIKAARKRKGWNESELAERCDTTRGTIRKIEQGNPGTEIGLYFEIANLLGIPLLAEDSDDLSQLQKRVDLELSVLPQRVRKNSGEIFDDF